MQRFRSMNVDLYSLLRLVERGISGLYRRLAFFRGIQIGTGALFCTLEMGLIDRSIDRSVKRCRPAWSIRMIRCSVKWSGAPLC
jgi:hypothetical protein